MTIISIKRWFTLSWLIRPTTASLVLSGCKRWSENHPTLVERKSRQISSRGVPMPTMTGPKSWRWFEWHDTIGWHVVEHSTWTISKTWQRAARLTIELE